MITEDIYQHRNEILKQGTPEQQAKFRAMISEYEKSKSSQASLPLSVQVAQFQEHQPPQPGAGANVLESEGHEPPPESIVNEGTRTDWVNATPPTDFGARIPGPAEGLSARAGQSIYTSQNPTNQLDESLPNASKLKKFQEPPEYSPPGMHLPDYIGGSTIHLHEPSPDKFEEDMGPILRARGIPPDPRDPRYQGLYSEYADKQYADAYKQAVATGTPIVRTDYVLQHQKGLGAIADYLAAKGTAKTFAFTEGLMNGVVPGSTAAILGAAQPLTDQPLLDQYREGQAANPNTAMAGTIVGTAMPSSLAGEAAGTIARGVGMGSVGRRLAGSAIGGAWGALGSTALQGASEGASLDDIMREGSTTAPIGLLLGAGGQALAEGAGAYRSHVRSGPLGKELGNAERSGVATDALRGLKAPPEMKAAIEEARPPVPGEQKSYFEGSPVEYQARKVEGPLAEANATAIKQEKIRQQDETSRFIQQNPSLRTERPMKATVRAAVDLLDQLSVPEARGGILPPGGSDALPGRSNAALAKFLEGSMKPELALATNADKSGMEARGAVSSLSLDQARQLGINVDKLTKELPPRDTRAAFVAGQGADPNATNNVRGKSSEDALRVLLVPRAYDAPTMDTQIKILDDLAKEGSSGKPDFVWDRLHAAAREDRGQFGEGWKSLKESQHERMSQLEQRAADAGLPAGDLERPNDVKAFRSALEQSGAPKQAAATKEAHLSLANEAGVGKGLGLLQGQRAYDALKSSTKVNASPIITSGGAYERLGNLGSAAQLRLDAVARAIARNPEGLSSITTKEIGPELMQYIRQMGPKPPPSSVEQTPPGAFMNLFGLGGGGLGIRAAQVYSSTGRDMLSDEDIANLLTLLKARGGNQPEAR